MTHSPILQKSAKTFKKPSNSPTSRDLKTHVAPLGSKRLVPDSKPKTSFNSFVHRVLRTQNMSPKVADHIANNSWRQSTALVMNTATKHWLSFCKLHDRPLLDFCLDHILDFLYYLSTGLNLTYCDVQDGKQFVMAIVKLLGNSLSAADKEVMSKFMKGIFNKKPPIKEHSKMHSWDVDIALDFFSTGCKNEHLLISELAGKVCLLILPSRMCRIGELALLDLEHMDIMDSAVTFTLQMPTKTFTPGSCNAYSQGLQKLTIKKFPYPKICPVEALYMYLKRTLPF